MDGNKQQQESSLIGRLLSMQGLIFLMGIVFLVSGAMTGEETQLFWGGLILGGSVLLYLVRKKDWKKHWEEQELFRQMVEERKAREAEEKKGDKP